MPRSYVFIFLSLFLSFAPTESLSENASNRKSDQESPMASYLKDLEKLGYCVIPDVLFQEEAKILYERVWHEFIEKAWPHCRMDDRSNWKEAFPIHNKRGIFAGPAGQSQVMWDLRQDPRIIEPFAHIWNTHDLLSVWMGYLLCVHQK